MPEQPFKGGRRSSVVASEEFSSNALEEFKGYIEDYVVRLESGARDLATKDWKDRKEPRGSIEVGHVRRAAEAMGGEKKAKGWKQVMSDFSLVGVGFALGYGGNLILAKPEDRTFINALILMIPLTACLVFYIYAKMSTD